MRVAVLGSAGSWYVRQLCRAGREQGHDVTPLTFPDLTAQAGPDGTRFRSDTYDLAACDAVFVRTMPPGSLEQVITRMDLLHGLEASGVRIVNPPRAIECAVDKWLTTQKLCQAALPVPDTAVCEDADTALELYDRFGGDVVVKPLFGSEGRGMLRVDSPEMAWRVFRTLERMGAVICVQRFLGGGGGDYRILLLDGQVLGAMHRSAAPGEFRTNAAQSGICSPWTPSAEAVELARAAARVTGCLFCGIDLIRDSSGRLNVLELNAVPGWKALQKVCEIDVPERLFRWLGASGPGNRKKPLCRDSTWTSMDRNRNDLPPHHVPSEKHE